MASSEQRPKISKYYWLIIGLFIAITLTLAIVFNILAYFPKILILIILIGICLILRAGRKFLLDWFLFLSVIYLSDTLRGLIYYLVNRLQLPVYCEYVVKLEESIFGVIPSVSLQNILLKNGEFTWIEKACTALHGTHFIAFIIIGFFIWLKDSKLFARFKVSFYILLTAGMSLYALIPTAPPWMASQIFGLMPPLVHFNLELYTMYIPDLTAGFNTNPVAAMPSLHAAFPILCCLILWSKYKHKAFIFYIYTGLILFTIVYTGDHYVVDIIFGIIIAWISFIISKNIRYRNVNNSQEKLKFNKLILKPGIIAGSFILIWSILIGQVIKTPLKNYYSQYTQLNFVDFINHPEKADRNYKIAIFLGDHYFSQGEQEQALCFYQKAQVLATTPAENFEVQRKIKQLKLETRSIPGQVSKSEPKLTLEYQIGRKLHGYSKGSNECLRGVIAIAARTKFYFIR